jgi:hypothetical protein
MSKTKKSRELKLLVLFAFLFLAAVILLVIVSNQGNQEIPNQAVKVVEQPNPLNGKLPVPIFLAILVLTILIIIAVMPKKK